MHAVWIRGGEHDTDGPAFGVSEQCSAPASCGVQYGAKVVGAALEGGYAIDWIRQPRTALVVEDHARERRKISDKLRPAGIRPQQVDVGEPPRDDHQVHRTVADDLIGEISPRALCVLRVRSHRLRANRSTVRAIRG